LEKLLIIQTASIGDVILATPVVEKLHHFYPEAKIDLLVKKGTESLFTGHPFLNIITWDKSNAKYRDFLKFLSSVRKEKYDAVINLQRFALTGILTAFSGSPMRIGFSKNPFSFFFSKKIVHEFREGLHEADRNLLLIEGITGEGTFKPRLYPAPSDEEYVKPFKENPYLTISPASLWFTKQYPVEKWIELIRKLDQTLPVLLLGSKQDVPLCDRIKKEVTRADVLNLAGKLSFLQSASLMKDAKMNFTNDSAPMHLASAVNAPVTVVYCSTVPSFGFGPLSDDQAIIETLEKLDCRPCGLHGFAACPEKHFRCALTISTDRLVRRT
jgi:ADP-heptose:LPS heptosyltransferase